MTEDKDFGELIVVQRRPHSGITPFLELSIVEQVVAMQEVLTYDEVDWKWGGHDCRGSWPHSSSPLGLGEDRRSKFLTSSILFFAR